MSKRKSYIKYLLFLIISLLLILLLLLSFFNINYYFSHPRKSRVLSAEIDVVLDEEQFWINYLNLYPNYFPGYIELFNIMYSKEKYNEADNLIIRAKRINPNSSFINQFQEKY